MLHDLGYECAARDRVFSQLPATFDHDMDVFVVLGGFSLWRLLTRLKACSLHDVG